MPTEGMDAPHDASSGRVTTVLSRPVDPAIDVGPPTVSVVVPVWNVGPYLRACLDSVIAQTIGLERIELIVVDDGSSDGSGAIVDEFARRYPAMTAIHEPNSGGPGHPRNVGLDRARGTYVFFLDADDYLGPEALDRLVAMAERNHSDIVIGKVVPVGTRPRRRGARLFARNVDRADMDLVYHSSSVLKLFRRSFVVESAIRFPETAQGGEDGDVMARLYPLATTVSIVADYDCYFARGRPGSQTTRSDRTDDLVDYIERIERDRMVPLAAMRRRGPGRDILMIKHIRTLLRKFGRRWAGLDPEEQRRVFDAGAAVLDRWDTWLIDRALPAWARIRVYCLRHGLIDELVDIASCPARTAFGGPTIEHGRIFARYPHFRDRSRIPDRCFDITAEVDLVQQVERAEVVDGHLRLSGEAYLSLLGGTTTIELRQWPTGQRLRLVPDVRATPDLRDTMTRYPAAGFDATIDLATALHGRPVPTGTWALRLATGIPGSRRSAPIRPPSGSAEGQLPPSGRAPMAVPATGHDAALYLTPGRELRLQIGPRDPRVTWLEHAEGVEARAMHLGGRMVAATRPGRALRLAVQELRPSIADRLRRD